VSIAANGDNAVGGAGTTFEFTPSAPGQYVFVASLAADSPNTLGVSATACADQPSNEKVTVRTIPTQITTSPFVFPQDQATITSSVTGNNLGTGGSVVFKLFGPTGATTGQTNCTNGANVTTVGTGGLLYTQTFTGVGGSHSVNVGPTTNSSVSVNPTTATTYWWRVTYTPNASDTAHTGIQSACVENTTVTVTGDSGPGTSLP
jgi:hypothetical protein